MVLATDSAMLRHRCRLVLSFGLLALAGCARLQAFHNTNDRPDFGTEPVAAPPVAATTAKVETVAETRPAPKPSAVPVVSLQPPETVAARSESAKPKPVETPKPPQGPSLNDLLGESRRRLEALVSYRVTMNLQERIGTTLRPPENVVLNIRRHPKAVRLEWPDGPSQGREVIYAADSNGGLMYIHMPNAIIPQLKMPPDSPLAMSNSRHPISDAGFDTILTNMEDEHRRASSGDLSHGEIRYEGQETPEGLNKPCYKIVRITPTKETWIVFLDPETYLPVFVQASAENGDTLERYLFRDLTLNPSDLASVDGFNPEKRWGPSRGLFQRLARGNSNAAKTTETR